MPTNHSISSATLRPSYRIPHIRAAATSVNPCTGARSATSHGTSVAADLPGCWSSPGAQNTGIRGRLPVGRPGLASLQCRPANNRFEGYRDSNPRPLSNKSVFLAERQVGAGELHHHLVHDSRHSKLCCSAACRQPPFRLVSACCETQPLAQPTEHILVRWDIRAAAEPFRLNDE